MTSVIQMTEEIYWDVSNWIFLTLFEQICKDLKNTTDDWGLLSELDDDGAATVGGFLDIGLWPRARQEFFLQLIQRNRAHWPKAELFHQALDELVEKIQRIL